MAKTTVATDSRSLVNGLYTRDERRLNGSLSIGCG